MLVGPALLSFAGIAPATVPAVPLEQHLAEKLHAYTRSYGAYAAVSSRPKDLVDIVLMAELQAYDAVALRDAVEQTFAVRATHALPDFLAPPPPAWGASYGALAGEVGVSPKLEDGYGVAARLFEPVFSNASGRWSAAAKAWQP